MIRTKLIILSIIFFTNCSFYENSRIWKNEKNKTEQSDNLVKIFSEKKLVSKELNPSFNLVLKNINSKADVNYNYNYYGSQKYEGKFNKIGNYKFSKIKNFTNFDLKPLVLNGALIFFDKKGTLIKYNDNSKVLWKNNFYSKHEKKLNPKLSLATKGDKLIVADNIAKYYSVNLKSGELIWSKNNQYPFNSEIKVFKDKFFVIDFNNTLRCYKIKDGSECWKLITESSFTVPNNKYSLVIVDNLIIFNNSIGDITAVNIFSGSIIWQLPTQSRSSINQTYNYKSSKLVTDGKSLFFSNNKNEFYSIDLKTGSINWKNDINSSLTPIIFNEFIFTISNEGYLFVIQKNKGNIIRIKDTYKIYKLKHRKNIKPVGFVIGLDKLYLASTNGELIVIDLTTGSINKTIKIARSKILSPYIYNQSLYLIKNGNIIQYD